MENRPVLIGLAAEIGMAYNVLGSKRTAGFSANPISLSDIFAYIQIFGMPSITVADFVDLIGATDIAYLELQHGNQHSN